MSLAVTTRPDRATHAIAGDEAMEVYEGGVFQGPAHRIVCSCGTTLEFGPEPGLMADEVRLLARHAWANHAQASRHWE